MVDYYPKTISYRELNNMFPGLDIVDEDEQQRLTRGRPEERDYHQRPKQKVCDALFTCHSSELTEFLRSRKASREEETMNRWNGAYSDVVILLHNAIHYLFLIVNKCHKGSNQTALFPAM